MKLLLLIFITWSSSVSVKSLSCYSCNSVLGDADCIAVAGTTSTTTCGSNSEDCRVYVTYVNYAVASVIRGCQSGCSDSNSVSSGTGVLTDCCDSGDECNDADYTPVYETCYSCDSDTDEDCIDIGEETENVTCSHVLDECRTLVTYEDGEVERVVRDCETSCSDADDLVEETGTITDCCNGTELCNGIDYSGSANVIVYIQWICLATLISYWTT